MSSDLFICVGCGVKSDATKQLCEQCTSNATLNEKPICNLHLKQENEEESTSNKNSEHEVVGITILDEAVCRYCDSVLDLDNAQDHYDNCGQQPIDCPLKCEKKCLRGQMAIHIEKCERNVHHCQFSPLGCHFKGSLVEVEKHQNDIKIHFKLMMNSVKNLQTEQSNYNSMTERSLNEIKDEINNKKSNEKLGEGNFCKQNKCCSNATLIHEELQQQIEKQNVEIDGYKQRIIQLEQEQTNINVIMNNKYSELGEKIDGINRTLDSEKEDNNVKYANLQAQLHNLELIIATDKKKLSDETGKMEESLGKATRDLDEMNNKLQDISARSVRLEHFRDTTLQKFHGYNYKLQKLAEQNSTRREINAKDIKTLRHEVQIAVSKSSAEINQTLDLLSLKQNNSTKVLEVCNEKLNGVINKTDLKMSTWNSFDYTWKVEMFSKLKDETKEFPNEMIYSDPFYNNPFGYKMRLCIFPNGHAVHDRTYLSVYCQIMKGINDAFLKWPVMYNATYTLFDPSDQNKQHSVRVDASLGDERHRKSITKPETEYNPLLGASHFITFADLTDKYLQNDSFFLKVNIIV